MAAGDPYQPLERIRERIEATPEDIFGDHPNAEARFDRLLFGTAQTDPDAPDAESWIGLEAEARGIIETLTGDQPLGLESDRTDTFRPSWDAALTLAYPVNSIDTVEFKHSLKADWQTLDTDRYTVDRSDRAHHLVLQHFRRTGIGGGRGGTRRNTLADNANRATWRDLAAKLRVTYSRGFDPIPADIKSVQIALINRHLRLMRAEQSFAAASPEEWQGVSPEFDRVVTEDIRDRLSDFTTMGGATMTM
jgi:hypothetical protein